MTEAGNELVRIAFVFGDIGAAAHVREALAGQVEIAYAASATEFDSLQAAAAGVISALVNLDGGDWLDPLEAALAAVGIRVVYNDPDTSAHLDGWERARWLRHLVAKLRGASDVDPPRPAAPGVATPAASVRKAERPLSAEEIASLTADFAAHRAPGDTAASGDENELGGLDIDTEALSAMIDARLAQPETQGVAREVDFAAADDVPPPAAAAKVSLPLAPAQVDPGVAAVAPAAVPAPGDWKLLDAEIPVVSANPPRRAAPTVALPDSIADLSLVPMESLAAVQRSSEPVELWLHDDTENKPRPEAGGGKA